MTRAASEGLKAEAEEKVEEEVVASRMEMMRRASRVRWRIDGVGEARWCARED